MVYLHMQDLTAETVAATGKGCYWNQDVEGLLREAGLRIISKEDSLGGLVTLIEAQKGL